jgi:hypothetical protein
MAAKLELLCIGNAMVDVFAEVPADFCEQFNISAPVQHTDADKAAAILAALSASICVPSGRERKVFDCTTPLSAACACCTGAEMPNCSQKPAGTSANTSTMALPIQSSST